MSFRISEKTQEKTARLIESNLSSILPAQDASLRFEDVAGAARTLLEALKVSRSVFDGTFDAATLRYYRRKGIISSPTGNTSNARYGKRHVLETAIARLAGQLHHLTLLETSKRIAMLDHAAMVHFLAELVCLDWNVQASRPRLPEDDDEQSPMVASPNLASPGEASALRMLSFPSGAVMFLPAGHPVFRDARRMKELKRQVEK